MTVTNHFATGQFANATSQMKKPISQCLISVCQRLYVSYFFCLYISSLIWKRLKCSYKLKLQLREEENATFDVRWLFKLQKGQIKRFDRQFILYR